MISASPKEMVDLTMLLARHHSRTSHSSQDDDNDDSMPLSPTSDEEPMSTDNESPGFRPRRQAYISESEGSVTEVRLTALQFLLGKRLP